MQGLNKACIMGTLGRDPESRSFQNGGKVVNLSIATSESWKDRNTGEKKEKTEWHRVAIFSEGLCGVAERFLRKGSQVYVEGKIQTRKWQDQNGQDKFATEIVLQGFDAKLIMIKNPDTRGGGGGGDRDDFGGGGGGQSSFGGGRGDFNGGGSRSGIGGGGGGGGFGGGFADDLDDDVPFVTASPAFEGRVS